MESITNTKKIVLEHNQNSFNLECTMLNFHAAELNQYAYYLEGFEKDWNLGSRNNMATYRNVPPGRYIFKVKGCNSFGVWSSEETTLEVIILIYFGGRNSYLFCSQACLEDAPVEYGC